MNLFKRAIGLVTCSVMLMTPLLASAGNGNAITLIEQQDRLIECHPGKPVSVKRGFSQLTGLKNTESYQPVLVEFYNENGGVYATAPRGIGEASVIYEYQVSTNGQTGIAALFQDGLPERVGPIGDASVGGMLIQTDWNCGYVYHDLPLNADGTSSDLAYSLQSWIDSNALVHGNDLFPANVSSVKEWKRCFYSDASMIIGQNNYVDTSGIKAILERKGHIPKAPSFRFFNPEKYVEADDAIPVSEVDIRTASKIYSSGFVYDRDSCEYARWVGESNQYGDVSEDKQLVVANVIVQRVDYTVADKNMAPSVIGKGNADIFTMGQYIEGYWVRDSMDAHTEYFDSNGDPVMLAPGTTYILLLSNSTSVVILNY